MARGTSHQPTRDGSRLASEVERRVDDVARGLMRWRECGTFNVQFAAIIVSGGSSSVTVACPGALPGKFAMATWASIPTPVDSTMHASVIRRDTVIVTWFNNGLVISAGEVEVRIVVEV